MYMHPGYFIISFFFHTRPRPDFLQRCFPDGKIHDDMKCKGPEAAVIQGYKSFPSGHSSREYTG